MLSVHKQDFTGKGPVQTEQIRENFGNNLGRYGLSTPIKRWLSFFCRAIHGCFLWLSLCSYYLIHCFQKILYLDADSFSPYLNRTEFFFCFLVLLQVPDLPDLGKVRKECVDPACKGHAASPLAERARTKSLYNPIGRLVVTFSSGTEYIWSSCTASLISESAVLTAAQCLYHEKHGWAVRILFSPSTAKGIGIASASRAQMISVPEEWAKSPNPMSPYNIGVAILARPIGQRLGWYDLCREACLQEAQMLEQVGYGYSKPSTLHPPVLMSSLHMSHGSNATKGIFPYGYISTSSLGPQSIGAPLIKRKKKHFFLLVSKALFFRKKKYGHARVICI